MTRVISFNENDFMQLLENINTATEALMRSTAHTVHRLSVSQIDNQDKHITEDLMFANMHQANLIIASLKQFLPATDTRRNHFKLCDQTKLLADAEKNAKK